MVCSSQTTSSLIASLPEAGRQWQTGVVRRSERAVGRNAAALEHGHDLARMLRRVPGAALHDVMQRLLAVIGCELRLRCMGTIALPPAPEARAHRFAIVADMLDARDIR